MAKSAKPAKGQSKASTSPKAAAKELAKLEQQLAKAREVESKRARQAADASAMVAKLTARMSARRGASGEAEPRSAQAEPGDEAPAS